jgi:hypothetical protein
VEEVLNMSQKEVNQHHLIRSVLDRKLSQAEAAKLLRLSTRQVRRKSARVRQQGAKGIIHGLRGQPSNNQLDPEVVEKALCALHDADWEGFGPQFASEKLEQIHDIRLSKETVRRLMLQTEIWGLGRRGWRHRQRRERRACTGMLVQLDGSTHDWFESRGPRCVLIIYIDDATSKILYGEFVKVEDTPTLMRATQNYLKRCGRPVAFYVDSDSIYKVNKPAKYEGLSPDDPMTQFTRAMGELGVEVICANSPQAKGRVERGFGTHQDRLVKELRLRGISAITQANLYLWEHYIPDHNRRFAVAPATPTDAHRQLLATHRLDQTLSLRAERTIMNDYTVRHNNKFFQVLEHQSVRLKPGNKVEVEERLDGSRHLRFKGSYLNFKPIVARPYRPLLVAQPSKGKLYHDPRIKGVGSIPAKDHPWRRFFAQGPYRAGLPNRSHVPAI